MKLPTIEEWKSIVEDIAADKDSEHATMAANMAQDPEFLAECIKYANKHGVDVMIVSTTRGEDL